MIGIAQRQTARKLLDLSLNSARQIEKADRGERFDREPIERLSETLVQVCATSFGGAQSSFLRPGLFPPLRGLYRYHNKTSAAAVETVRSFVLGLAENLKQFAGRGSSDEVTASELLGYCLALHSEIVSELSARDPGRPPKRELAAPCHC
jgi:hypothetical protein